MFQLSYYKPKNREFLDYLENAENVSNVQSYIPIYQSFFDLNETNYNSISFNHRNQIIDKNLIIDTKTDKNITTEVFIKYSPVIDPIHYMMGKYDISDIRLRTLPNLTSTNETTFPKMLDYNNSSYVDGFFTFLSSILLQHHGFIHGVDYYGSFMGIQKDFKINVIDDLEHLDDCDFFHKHLNNLFTIDNPFEAKFFCDNSRKCKSRLLISDENVDIEIDDIEMLGETDIEVSVPDTSAAVAEIEVEYEKPQISELYYEDNDDSSSLNYTTDGDIIDEMDEIDIDSGSDEDTEYTDIDSSENTDETTTEVFATIYDFPVNMICMEKCTGTLDSIINNLNEDEWRSALFQVVMILLTYQKAFYLTHNDLHTNNIMYVSTAHKHIYYKFNKKYYKVPTYGRIYKIIDYGRAIYTFSGKLFCSDSFSFHGDASTQYNFPPYYNDKKPFLEPNYSFDLCRLGCSIYDFVFENENSPPQNDFEQVILDWCTDDNGKNVMYKKNGEERYMDFKLYKMIARTVHNHTPDAQLKRAFFQQYCIIGSIDSTATAKGLYINIDEIPCYVSP